MTPEPAFVIEEVHDLDAVWEELTALFYEFTEYSRAFIGRPSLTPEWKDSWRASLEGESDRLILITRIADEAVAFMNARIAKHPLRGYTIGFIEDAFVRPHVRRKGIGSALYEATEAWCRANGAVELRLQAIVADDIAADFWVRQGFEPFIALMSKSLSEARQ